MEHVIASESLPWYLVSGESSRSGIISNKKEEISPDDTVEELEAKAKDWTEPSRASEEVYVAAMRRWLDTLEPFKRERARKIMSSAHPALRDLREAIRQKKAQLAGLSFDRGMAPETLPRLGMELQQLRADLHARLKAVARQLRYEAGVEMGPMENETFWLSPPSSD